MEERKIETMQPNHFKYVLRYFASLIHGKKDILFTEQGRRYSHNDLAINMYGEIAAHFEVKNNIRNKHRIFKGYAK